MKVRDIMNRNLACVKADTHVRDVVRTMYQYRTTGVCVVDDQGHLAGFIPQRNLIVHSLASTGRLPKDPHRAPLDSREFVARQRQMYGQTANDVMVRDVITIHDMVDVTEAMEKMLEKHVTLMPVLRGDRLVGTLSRTDILKTMLDMTEDGYAHHSAEGAPSDEEVRRRVLEALRHEMRVHIGGVQVAVSHGTVTLRGFVSSPADVKTLQDLVEGVPGVRQVVNLLLIEQLLD